MTKRGFLSNITVSGKKLTEAQRRYTHYKLQRKLGFWVPEEGSTGPRGRSTYRAARRNATRAMAGGQ